MKQTHLLAASLALSLIACLLVGATLYSNWLERRYVHALVPVEFSQKYLGSALQRAAFDQPDLLPIYGSSEWYIQKPYQDPYRAINVFRGEPTGFTVFPIGYGDTTDLLILQRLAAVGPKLRGKKVVISLSPTWFFERLQEPHKAYAGNFSRLQAGAVVFSTDLSFDLKQSIARRMLEYPETLAKDTLLRFAVEQLANSSPLSRALYYLALPLGQVQNLILRLQDHWEMIAYLSKRPDPTPETTGSTKGLDWSALFAAAERETRQHTNNNNYGFDNDDWNQGLKRRASTERRLMSDAKFRRGMQLAREWTDFELLLRTLRELGAKPLVLSMPIGGTYYDYLKVSQQARDDYYAKIRQLSSTYGAQVRDFADHDRDNMFVLNARGHLLPKGWVYYDQALDNFYHSRPLQ